MSKPHEAKSYHFGGVGEYPTIDGEPIPWWVPLDEDRGVYPMVQSLGYDQSAHVLWLPVLVGAPLPTPPNETPCDAVPIPGLSEHLANFPEAPPPED